jgi:hypothetical protein
MAIVVLLPRVSIAAVTDFGTVAYDVIGNDDIVIILRISRRSDRSRVEVQ